MENRIAENEARKWTRVVSIQNGHVTRSYDWIRRNSLDVIKTTLWTSSVWENCGSCQDRKSSGAYQDRKSVGGYMRIIRKVEEGLSNMIYIFWRASFGLPWSSFVQLSIFTTHVKGGGNRYFSYLICVWMWLFLYTWKVEEQLMKDFLIMDRTTSSEGPKRLLEIPSKFQLCEIRWILKFGNDWES